MAMAAGKPEHFLELPNELTRKIFDYLTFDTVAQLRAVSRRCDAVCKAHLNAGLRSVEQYQARSMSVVKARLPRRESERRNHSLCKHSDILTAIETRLSLLGMTYNKFMDLQLCCFIPGKVLDEMFCVLRSINQSIADNTQPGRPHELLQELRDISSMAMEYFDDKIAPILRDRALQSCTPTKNARDNLSMLMIGAVKGASGGSRTGVGSSPVGVVNHSATSTIFANANANATPSTSTARLLNRSPAHELEENWQLALSGMVEQNDDVARLRSKVTAHSVMVGQLKKANTAMKTKISKLERLTGRLEKDRTELGKTVEDMKRKLDEMGRKMDEDGKKLLHYGALFAGLSAEGKVRLTAGAKVPQSSRLTLSSTSPSSSSSTTTTAAASRKRSAKSDCPSLVAPESKSKRCRKL